MAILFKLLPLLLLGLGLWWFLTSGSRMRRSLMRRSRPLDDWSLLELTNRFAERLETRPFDVRILDMDEVNGLALPGGEIFISRGLYEKYLGRAVTRDEVAAVVAHEIGHVALGHHKRRMTAWGAETAALTALALLLGRAVFGWVGLLAALGLRAARNNMSHRDEFEADAFSAQLMMRSGADPNAAVSLLEKLARWSGGGGGVPQDLAWLSSHPPIPKRVEALKQVIEAG